ncbi:MAG: (Fe-S)-binding protein [Bacteroides sp.]|nr:(Fe-S)-binding protein [Bacteroides sp.]MCM1380095.1 (Fe-S)-binding protein [Bacteroides sp.]MCM1445672.1 (Fe-S)-binding protein [Prevotella sp.]
MKVGFFVPCYMDALAPQAAKSSLELIQRFDGIEAEFIPKASCCALPFTDMGYDRHACRIEAHIAPMLNGYDCIVVPSGVCTDQFRQHFDSISQTDEVKRLRSSVYDVVEFLHDVLQVRSLPWARFPHRVALHNGCHSLRYLHHARPSELMEPDFSKTEDLLRLVDGLEVSYATRRDECCGFGGTFSMWDAPCGGQMGLDKVNDYLSNDLHYVTSADFSCLLHQQTVAAKHRLNIKTYYIAEILNGDASD